MKLSYQANYRLLCPPVFRLIVTKSDENPLMRTLIFGGNFEWEITRIRRFSSLFCDNQPENYILQKIALEIVCDWYFATWRLCTKEHMHACSLHQPNTLNSLRPARPVCSAHQVC